MIWRSLALAILLATVSAQPASAAKRITLPSGLRVVLAPSVSTDVVAIEVLLDVSAADEPPDRQGIRFLTQRLLLRGAAAETGAAAARRLAEVGGVAEATLGLDYVELYALAPADGFEVALQILADAVTRPAFEFGEVERQRAEAQVLARAARDEPFQETYLAFREALYGDHPYGALTLGRPSTLDAVSREDLVAFHQAHYTADRAVVAVCGGVGETRALRAIREAFGDWPSGYGFVHRLMPEIELRASELVARERRLQRAHMVLGFPAPAAAEGDHYYALQVIDSVLGGGVAGRLHQLLREDLGLVYAVSTFYPTLSGSSHFAVYAVTEPGHVPAVKNAILGVLRELQQTPVSTEELERAKRYLLGSYALSRQRVKDQAYSFAWYEVLGQGVEFEERYIRGIEAVTAQQVQETARSAFRRFALAVSYPTE